MQPDLPEPRQEPGRSPFDDLRERLARLPASHPSAPGYRDWPDEPAGPDARAGDGSRAGDGPPGGGSPDSRRPDPVAAPADAAVPGDAEQDDAGEPEGTGDDSEPGRPGPAGPDMGPGAATHRPGWGRRAGGTAVGYLPVDGGDGPHRPWFTGEPPQLWFTGEPPQPWFSDDPAGRSG
jgi:hypothetical protein